MRSSVPGPRANRVVVSLAGALGQGDLNGGTPTGTSPGEPLDQWIRRKNTKRTAGPRHTAFLCLAAARATVPPAGHASMLIGEGSHPRAKWLDPSPDEPVLPYDPVGSSPQTLEPVIGGHHELQSPDVLRGFAHLIRHVRRCHTAFGIDHDE